MDQHTDKIISINKYCVIYLINSLENIGFWLFGSSGKRLHSCLLASCFFLIQCTCAYLQGGKVVEGLSGQVLKPSRLDILGNTAKPDSVSQQPVEPTQPEIGVILTTTQKDESKNQSDKKPDQR